MMQQDISSIDPKWIINVLSALGAAVIAYYVGLRTYFRQKEFELVQKRYLYEGIDKVASEAEEALNVFQHNWAVSLFALKLFRDIGPKPASAYCQKALLTLQHSSPEVGPGYRLKALVGNDVFWEVQQMLLGDVLAASFFFMRDLGGTFDAAAEGKEPKVTPQQVYDKLYKECMRWKQIVDPFYRLVGALQNISIGLEGKRFRFRTIQNFKNTDVVRRGVEELRMEFGDRLTSMNAHEFGAKSMEDV